MTSSFPSPRVEQSKAARHGTPARARHVLPALWAGVLICIAAIAAPAAFSALPSAEAGQVVSRIFVREGWLSLIAAAVLLWLESRQGPPGRFNSALLWATLACTLLGYFAVRALLPAARLGQGLLSFGQLHLISTLFYGLKTALVLGLAWRVAGPELSRRPSS